MEQIGTVKDVKEGYAIVSVRRASSCGEHCASCSGGCAPTGVEVVAKNPVNAVTGQFVKLEMEKKKVLKAAFLVYIAPLIGLIMGIVVGPYISRFMGIGGNEELSSIGFGFLFLLIFYLILNRLDKKMKDSGEMEVTITEIIS